MIPDTENIVYWNQLKRGNYGISAEMLSNAQGQVVPMKCCIKDPNGRSKDVWEYRRVLFDRKFVVNWIINRVVEPLMMVYKVDFDKLMAEVWEEYYKRFQESDNDGDE